MSGKVWPRSLGPGVAPSRAIAAGVVVDNVAPLDSAIDGPRLRRLAQESFWDPYELSLYGTI